MKTQKIALPFLAASLLAGCQTDSAQWTELINRQQTDFATFLSDEVNKLEHIYVDQHKKEFYRAFERRAYHYFDSLQMLVHWQGRLADVQKQIYRNHASVSFTIVCDEQSVPVTFHCKHLLTTKNLDTDYIFGQFATLSDSAKISFDAVVKTKNNGTIKYHTSSLYDRKNVAEPDYQIYIVDIEDARATTSMTHYENVHDAVQCAFELVEPERLNYLGKLSDEGKNVRVNRAMLALRESMKSLNDDERNYIARLVTALRYNFRYGD